MNGVADTNVFGQASKGPTIYSVTTTGFTFMSGDESVCTGFWIAVGY
jgi:hypothetical protein